MQIGLNKKDGSDFKKKKVWFGTLLLDQYIECPLRSIYV